MYLMMFLKTRLECMVSFIVNFTLITLKDSELEMLLVYQFCGYNVWD